MDKYKIDSLEELKKVKWTRRMKKDQKEKTNKMGILI